MRWPLPTEHCRDCHDFHIVHAVVRVLGDRPGIGFDRPVMIKSLRSILAGRSPDGPVDIVIAGAADAAQFATAAHAADRRPGPQTHGSLSSTGAERRLSFVGGSRPEMR